MARVIPVKGARDSTAGERRQADVKWRTGVDKAILDLQRGQAEINEGQLRNERAVEENTRLTREGLGTLDRKIDLAIASTKPVTDALSTMESGIKTLGFIGRWGKRTVVAGLYCLGGWLFLRHLIAGEGLEAAVGAFWKVIAPK